MCICQTKAFKPSYISDTENSGQNKISQQLAEVKRVLFYGVDFALLKRQMRQRLPSLDFIYAQPFHG